MGDRTFILVTLAMGAFMFAFLVAPVISILRSIEPAQLLAQARTAEVLLASAISFASATITLLFSSVLGIPFAYVLARRDFFMKPAVEVAVLFPLVLPPLVGGISLLTLFGPYTAIGAFFSTQGLETSGSMLGIIIAQTFVSSPYLILTSKAAFQSIDRRLEDISLTLGKSKFETFRRVTLPLAKKGILAGMALTWARAVGEFGATIIMAYHPYTLPVKIWVDFTGGGLAQAVPVVLILIAICAAIVAGVKLLGRDYFVDRA